MLIFIPKSSICCIKKFEKEKKITSYLTSPKKPRKPYFVIVFLCLPACLHTALKNMLSVTNSLCLRQSLARPARRYRAFLSHFILIFWYHLRFPFFGHFLCVLPQSETLPCPFPPCRCALESLSLLELFASFLELMLKFTRGWSSSNVGWC